MLKESVNNGFVLMFREHYNILLMLLEERLLRTLPQRSENIFC